ncbi:fucose 4-O-acetylase-like acetyltransferase [Lipingzhangella halophila]|uniref:Fucose 4-O-acetylase-like acetyltransferase n=1 Tax=Lipingzhangella halophila TaxID=1783352 RepID=A0A7W7W5I1_9ACTN|nr:acyltransferase family protein [Lipingzhangella halophila]MBB4933810.1 fucose 4-O-acetylase-like acetyltransferase [Lipingzhangella halophila]
MASTTTDLQDEIGNSSVSPPDGAADAHRAQGASPGNGGAPKKRDALLDNAKFILIVLVFVGHAIEPLTDTRIAEAVYFWIYLFHMPAFVLISGYLSRSYDGSRRRIDKLLTTIATPYLIFWGIYALQSLSAGRDLPDSPLQPLWITWFLAALFIWRLTVPLWNRIRWPFAVSIGISFLGGMVATGEVLSESRILSLLPFFVAGLLVEQRHLDILKSAWVRAWSVGVVLVTAAMTYVYLEQLSREWVYWRESLIDRNVDMLPIGLPGRVTFLVLAFSLTIALLSLVPHRTTRFTKLGALTMYVFLLHGLVLRVAEQLGWYEFINDYLGTHGALVVNCVLAVAFTFVLCTPWVRSATRWAVEPRTDWILGPERDTAPGSTTPASARR